MVDERKVIPLTDAPAYFPNRPHWGTVVRWALKGVQVGGERVRLRSVKIGGRRYTDLASIEAFIATVSGARERREELSRQRGAAIRDAERELDREGI